MVKAAVASLLRLCHTQTAGLPMLQRFIERLRHWFTYQPERRYMRGRDQHGSVH